MIWLLQHFIFLNFKIVLWKRRNNFYIREGSLLHTGLVFKSEDILLANMQRINIHFCAMEVHRPVISLDSEQVSASCYQQSIVVQGTAHKLLKLLWLKGEGAEEEMYMCYISC